MKYIVTSEIFYFAKAETLDGANKLKDLLNAKLLLDGIRKEQVFDEELGYKVREAEDGYIPFDEVVTEADIERLEAEIAARELKKARDYADMCNGL